eukprot:c44017_g1_i1 orf=1-228(-)
MIKSSKLKAANVPMNPSCNQMIATYHRIWGSERYNIRHQHFFGFLIGHLEIIVNIPGSKFSMVSPAYHAGWALFYF